MYKILQKPKLGCPISTLYHRLVVLSIVYGCLVGLEGVSVGFSGPADVLVDFSGLAGV